MEIKKVFFSYSRMDADFVLKLALDLKKEGFDVWIDKEDIRAGSAWDLEIEKALETCDCLLFIQSAQSVNSANVLDEVYYALESNKKVIPVIIGISKTPLRINRLQHINFIANYEVGLASLLDNLKSGSFAELSPVADEKASKKITSLFRKKAFLYVLLIAFLITAATAAIIYTINTNAGDTKNEINNNADTALLLPETFRGEWTLVDTDPKAANKRGHLKVEAAGEDKVNILTNFQFYYVKSNDTVFFSVFNGYAECTSCRLQYEMQLTKKQIDIGTQRYGILNEDRLGEGKAGDTILSAGSNHSISAKVTLQLINKDTVTIKVIQPGVVPLEEGLTIQPFEYSFLFTREF